jgi:hypothetical protein
MGIGQALKSVLLTTLAYLSLGPDLMQPVYKNCFKTTQAAVDWLIV